MGGNQAMNTSSTSAEGNQAMNTSSMSIEHDQTGSFYKCQICGYVAKISGWFIRHMHVQHLIRLDDDGSETPLPSATNSSDVQDTSDIKSRRKSWINRRDSEGRRKRKKTSNIAKLKELHDNNETDDILIANIPVKESTKDNGESDSNEKGKGKEKGQET